MKKVVKSKKTAAKTSLAAHARQNRKPAKRIPHNLRNARVLKKPHKRNHRSSAKHKHAMMRKRQSRHRLAPRSSRRASGVIIPFPKTTLPPAGPGSTMPPVLEMSPDIPGNEAGGDDGSDGAPLLSIKDLAGEMGVWERVLVFAPRDYQLPDPDFLHVLAHDDPHDDERADGEDDPGDRPASDTQFI